MNRKLWWMATVMLVAGGGSPAARAQSFVASELVTTDTTPGKIADAINDLEFFDNGLFWSVPTLIGGVEFSHNGGAGILAQRDKPYSTPHYTASTGLSLAFVTRDNTFVYYTGTDGVHRKPTGSRPDNPNVLLGQGWSIDEPGAMMMYAGRLYYAYGNSTPLKNADSSHMQMAIEYLADPGGAAAQTPLRVAMGTTLPNDPGAVVKMGVANVHESGVSSLVPRGVCLTANGYLLSFTPDYFGVPLFMEVVLMAQDVADYTIRREQTSGGDLEDVVYAATGRNVCAGEARATIKKFNALNGNSTLYWTAPDAMRLTAIGADSDYLFVSSFAVGSAGIFGGCSTVGTGVIRSKYQPAGANKGLTDPNWDAIELMAGEHLRSDGQYLYFTYQQQIRRMPNNSPRLVLDLAAVGLEAVQAVQDFNNSVPLVAGKPMLVRGYAKIAQNSTGLPGLSAGALLHASRNGTDLPGSPIYAENAPLIAAAGDLASLRQDLQRSFQFHPPVSWLTPGTLTLTLAINPNLSAPENLDMLGNNSVSANVMIVPSRRPTLVFKPMSSTHPNYDPMAPGSGFWEIIARARTLLPVEDFNVFFEEGSVTKPVATLFGIRGRSFTMPDDKDWALIWMTVDHLFSSSPDGNPDLHYIGMFPEDDAPFNGIGGAPGVKLSDLMDNPPVEIHIPDTDLDRTLVVRMSNKTGNAPTNAWASLVGGHTLAHELGHNYGRFHIRQPASCGSQDPLRPWQSYPANACTLGETNLNDHTSPIGYDPLSASLILPAAAGDLMSYADSDWVSPFTWNALVAAIPTGNAPQAMLLAGRPGRQGLSKAGPPLPPHGPIFVLEGIIHADGNSGQLLTGFRLPQGTLDPAMVQSSLNASTTQPANAPYHLRLLGDPRVDPLDDRPVTLMGPGDGDASTLIFVQAVPDVTGVTRVQLMNGNTVLSEIIGSANAPSLVLGQPVVDTNAQSLSLSWIAFDADGDPLLFSVQFSADGGTNWQSLLVNQPDTGIALSTRRLAGSSQCVVRVIASDGFNTTLAVTDPFIIPTHAPEVMISGLADGHQITMGSTAPIMVAAYDAEDGSLPAAGVQWAITGPAALSGQGGAVSLSSLPPGRYNFSAQATDADGNPGSAQAAFTILPLTVLEAAAPVVDGYGADSGYADAPIESLSPPASQPGARLIHAGGFLYAIIEGLPQSAAGAAPASVQLAFAATDAADTTPQPGDVAISVDENGLAQQTRGDGASLASDAMTAGVHAVITRRGNYWNTELAVPDSVMGGWNHRGRFALSLQSQPTQTLSWPASASPANPSTWAVANFGSVPPAASTLPPVAVAAGPSVLTLDGPTAVGLNGAGSYDPAGQPLTYAWSQLGGPTVDLQGADSATPLFAAAVPDAPVTLVFQLVVNNGQTNSLPAQASVQLFPESVTVAKSGKPGVTIDPTDGSALVQFMWPGPAGSPTVIQASTNLADWTDLANPVAGPLQMIALRDAAAGQYPMRYYRAHSASATQTSAAGQALQFPGTDSLVTVPSDPALNAWPITIMAWINTTQFTGAYPAMISKYLGGQACGYALALDNGRFTPWYYVDANNHVEELTGAQLDGLFVADGIWHHLAYAVGETNAQIYIDGTLMRDLHWIGTPGAVTTALPLLFGRYDGGSGLPFAGQLDEVSLWSRALSETEIRAHMHHVLQGSETNLLGYWRFDESGVAAAADTSGQSRDGTLSGSVSRMDSTAPIYP